MLDTARADALEPYGAPAGASPVVADLARRGRALTDVFSTACWTMPSHVSMLTGALPREVGLSRSPDATPLGPKPVLRGLAGRLLPEVMRRAGFSTRAVSANVWISEAGGFDTGFERFVGVQGDRQARLDRRELRERLAWIGEAVRAKADDGAAAAEQVLRGWLDEWSGQPFFWFVNLVECHSPYLPPRPYGDVGAIGRARAAVEARRHLTMAAIWQACLGEFDVPDGALERMRRLYAASVRYTDDWLGRVLEAMDAKGVLDDTLVIVTSDHGENFGEGGLLAHAYSLDDRLTRVPFVAAGPGVPDGVRSLAELPAVIARAADLETDPWRERDLPGAAVAQFDPPGSPSDPRVVEALERWGVGETGRARAATPLTIATDGRRKLQRRGGIEELFDLEQDPLEVRPGPPVGEGVDALRAALDHPVATAVAPTAPSAAPAADAAELAALEERMKLLGYL